MEAFSLLKYWRGAGVTGNNASTVSGTTTTTIAETVRPQAVETDEDEGDEGSFFDMEFMPDDEDGEGGDDDDGGTGSDQDVYSNSGHYEEDDGGSSTVTDGEREFNFTLSSVSSGGNSDANLSLSPSDDLFSKGRLVPLEP